MGLQSLPCIYSILVFGKPSGYKYIQYLYLVKISIGQEFCIRVTLHLLPTRKEVCFTEDHQYSGVSSAMLKLKSEEYYC